MTYEEVKTRLEKIYKNMSDGYTLALEHGANKDEDFEYEIDSITIAMDCIEKQIPKNPIIDFMPRGDFYYCPNCNEIVKSYIVDTPIVDEYNHNYCGGCGQAIDWSDEE